jgi:tetrahydromethanopterin S-methyltransferase subunit G
MATTGWQPTLGELARRIDHVDTNVEHIRHDMVGKEIYASHREQHSRDFVHLNQRLDEMEAKRQATQRMLWGVLLTTLGSLAAQLVSSGLLG